MLEARNVSVRYGRVQALADVSLRIEPGELVVLLGPNGAGKTTTLRVASGLVAPASGVVLLDGSDVSGHPPERLASSGVAHVPEGRSIFARLTVEQNLLVGLYPRRRQRLNRHGELDRVLGYFPALRPRVRQRAGTLSGGEQQMLALGRALMARPRVLLVDEPSHGLAPMVAAELFGVFDELRRSGLGVLVVEQQATHALDAADRAYVLEKGRITYEGRTSPLVKDRKRLADIYLGSRV